MATLITQSEYAKRRKAAGLSGGTFQAVRKAVESGRITAIEGKIDPEVADIQREKYTRKRCDYHGDRTVKSAPVVAVTPDDLATQDGDRASWSDAKARTEAAIAELKELELARRKGELVDRAGVERAAFQEARIFQKTLVDVFPSRVAIELAALSDPWDVECFLRDSIRTELASIANHADEREHASV